MPGDETLEVQINAKAFPAPDGSKRPVLRDVAFSAGMGLILAFFGPSGMGKSTILRIAAGLDADFEGFVRRPPGRLGMMFQEPRLAPWLSVADNIRLVATKGRPLRIFQAFWKKSGCGARQSGGRANCPSGWPVGSRSHAP